MIILKSLFVVSMILSEPPSDMKLGERLTLASCGVCHLGDDGKLSGKLMTDVPKSLGTIYSSNITNDAANGIANWTKEDLEKLLRTGRKKNGDNANIMMPRYKRMADSDLSLIIAYLKSGEGVSAPSNEKSMESKLKLPAKMAPGIKKINKEILKGVIAKPDTTNHVAYGKYLVDDVLHCYSCHLRSPKGVNFNYPDKSKGYMGGGSKFPGPDGEKIVSLNLTFDKSTGLGNHTSEDFIKVMKTGQRKNGEWMRFPMVTYGMLTENDLSAIYDYLKTLPIIH